MSYQKRPLVRFCIHCKKQFPIMLGQNLILYCSELCHLIDNAGERPNDPEECWLWKGRLTVDGYAISRYASVYKEPGVHIHSYKLFNGAIPDDLQVRHTCNIRHCINPNHLILGTSQDNMADMMNANRSARGIKHHSNKLTEEQVIEIYKSPKTIEMMSLHYGVTTSSIRDIKAKRTWLWLTKDL